MIMFIVCGLVLTVSLGGFFAMIFTSGMKDNVFRLIASIIIAFAIGFVATGLFFLEHRADEQMFNSGYCECGGEWDLFDVEKMRNSGSKYYYKCLECKDVIELHTRF